MGRSRTEFRCEACGHGAPKWMGRCPTCREWNTFREQAVDDDEPEAGASAGDPGPLPEAVRLAEVRLEGGSEMRLRVGIDELDRPLGGGLVTGSLVLVGGDPGVGKSTLLLAVCERLAARGLPVLYVTGEESAQQVKLRADRLGVMAETLYILATTRLDAVDQAIHKLQPVVLVIDSVQTLHVPEQRGIPGSVGQVREVAHHAMRIAKSTHCATFLVGHVTKSGDIAGPKMLEHLVDAVLYFEGDGRSSLRILRSVKNRFGAAGELGMFEMGEEGLREVPDASARLLDERCASAPGTAVVAAVEGTRPVLAEIQALVGRPGNPTPARTCNGVDRTRVLMLAAVLEKAGLPLHDRDLFVNAAGGLRLVEPATDLAIAAAIWSSLHERPLPDHTLLFGEVGLVGEIRAVSHPAARLREAGRHGFRRVVAPSGSPRSTAGNGAGGSSVGAAPGGSGRREEVELCGVRTVRDALRVIAGPLGEG